jgi:hypothetical protein
MEVLGFQVNKGKGSALYLSKKKKRENFLAVQGL